MGTLHYLEWEYAFEIKLGDLHILCAAASQKALKCKSCFLLRGSQKWKMHSKVLSGIQYMDWISPLHIHVCSYVTHENVASSLPGTLLSGAPTLHCLPLWTPSMKPPYHQSPSGVLFSLYGMKTDKSMAVLLILPTTSLCEN